MCPILPLNCHCYRFPSVKKLIYCYIRILLVLLSYNQIQAKEVILYCYRINLL
jgi:hypothetical protein